MASKPAAGKFFFLCAGTIELLFFKVFPAALAVTTNISE